MDKITAMLTLQQQLNDATNGKGWEAGITKNGKRIDWRRCIYLEVAELIESYPWKHWKSITADPDYANIKIEAVDIWHFVMSEALRIYSVEERGDITVLAEKISQSSSYKLFRQEATKKHSDHYAEITVAEKLIQSLFCDDSDNSIEELIGGFFTVARQSGLDPNSLYELYIGKNILNQFRQDHGYKEGSYTKLWNGREDNVIMQEILDRHNEIAPDELYSKLKATYPAIH